MTKGINKLHEENKDEIHNISNSRLNPKRFYRQNDATRLSYNYMLSKLKNHYLIKPDQVIQGKKID